jgi:hypothetical protein
MMCRKTTSRQEDHFRFPFLERNLCLAPSRQRAAWQRDIPCLENVSSGTACGAARFARHPLARAMQRKRHQPALAAQAMAGRLKLNADARYHIMTARARLTVEAILSGNR